MSAKNNIIFGPVNSRRFGMSLGIDLSPALKQCNFDCLYCELSPAATTDKQSDTIRVQEIIQELKTHLTQNIDVITLTANGGVIYPLIVNISWGANFLDGTFLDLHMYDLAGSTVIHSTGGWALLAAILIMGPRKGRYKNGKIKVIPASNIPLVVLGALLLWIGWFGFNGGSVGSISSVENANTVAKTIMNTNTAGLAGAIIAGIIMYIRYKLLDITMVLNGALGGLVAITAGPDLYDMYTPILIGTIGGALVVFAVPLFDKLQLDDPVGALSVHLVNGIWGTLAVGIFVDSVSIFDQLKGIAVVALFAFVSSYIVLFIINKLVSFRATDDVQVEGLDVNEVGVEAYPEFKRAI